MKLEDWVEQTGMRETFTSHMGEEFREYARRYKAQKKMAEDAKRASKFAAKKNSGVPVAA